MSTLKVVVMGSGGVGGYFGAKLARAGHAVTFVARGAHLDAIRRRGLTVHSAAEGEFSVAVEAAERLDDRSPADLVLITVKCFDTADALAAVRPVVGPDTAVLSLQNGVEAIERIDAALGPGHALGGAAYVFASIEAPGVIVHRFAGRIVLGEPGGGTSPRAERICEAIAKAGIPVEISPDIRPVLWEKYVMICAQAGATAVTRCPTGVVRAVPETWRLFRALAEELAALAAAAGVRLSAGIVDTVVATAAGLAPQTSSSLAFDLSQGKRLELEALHGHAVRLAERLGVAVPSVFAVYAALKPWLDGPPPDPASAGGRDP
ncbi:MAG TPA: 2-dehydropantoate 2-reductase [Methylomirabilota bacterium]|nr:2-dehydropantoate 2-reductase [Methylomirabilota bacterium]